MWRNSLVFHDVEKITSLYIHIFPGLLLYALRWYPHSPGRYTLWGYMYIYIYDASFHVTQKHQAQKTGKK